MNYDICLVGVGGQGVLTIADILCEAALRVGVPFNYYPTKGMAQRGGFVKAHMRLGRLRVGPQVPEQGADLAISMELSEGLKAVRFVKHGGDFVLYSYVWQPAAVMLGKALYPSREQVLSEIDAAGARVHFLHPAELPRHGGRPVAPNVFLLGAAVGRTPLRQLRRVQIVHTSASLLDFV